MEKSKLKKHTNVTEYFIKFLNGTTSNRPKLVHPNIFKWWEKEDKEQRELKILKVRLILIKLVNEIIHHQKILNIKELQYFIKICDEYIVKYEVKNGKVEKGFELAPSSKFKEYMYPVCF